MAAQSVQRNNSFMTRFIESVPRNSCSFPPSPVSSSGLHTQLQPQPQLPPLSPTSNEGNVAGPVLFDSSRSMLSRRLRHASLRLSPTTPARSGARDNHHTRNSSSMLAPAAEPSQRMEQPQHPQISKISPIISPLSTTRTPSEVISTHIVTRGDNILVSSMTRKHKYDDEEVPPSPCSSTRTLMLQDSQFESRTDETVSMFTRDRTHGSILPAETADKMTSQKSEATPPQEHSIYSQSQSTRDTSRHSRKPGIRLSLSSSHRSRSQRNSSQPMSLTCSDQFLEQPQLLPMQTSGQQYDDQSTSMLSYASLPVNPGQPIQHDYIPSGSMFLPSTSRTASDNQTEILKHPLQDPITEQPQVHQGAENAEDRESVKVALSSVTGSPRRSISRYDSPEVTDRVTGLGSSSDRMMAPMSIGPCRRKRESVAVPRDHFASPFTRRQQPENLVTGNLGEMSVMSYTSSRGQSADGTHTSGDSQPAQALLLVNPPPTRTLDSVRNQVATEIAYRAVSKSNVVDGVRVAVADASSAWSGPDDISFIHLISSSLNASSILSSTPYLFIITATSFSPTSTLTSCSKAENGSATAAPATGLLYITSSSCKIASRAVHLTCSKFIGRITSSSYTFSTPDIDIEKAGDVSLGLATKELEWMARIKELHFSSFDSDVIHSILLTASRTPLDPTVPPPNSKSIDIVLGEARAQLTRITPRQALTELGNPVMQVPTLLVDIRPQAQREEFGEILGALIVERNVLEWRFDPRCESRLPIADRYDLRIIVFCQEGYASSLAARSLQQLGLLNATDIIGGYKAWKDARLPVKMKPCSSASVPRSVVRVP